MYEDWKTIYTRDNPGKKPPIGRAKFYRLIPNDVTKQKFEKCCCPSCKKGLNWQMRVRSLAVSLREDAEREKEGFVNSFDQLTHHLKFELVARVKSKHHPAEDNFNACECCRSQIELFRVLTTIIKSIKSRLPREIEAWIFEDGIGICDDDYRVKVEDWLNDWNEAINSWRQHLWRSGHQYMQFENVIQSIEERKEEVWLFDFMMPLKLHQSTKETQEQFMNKEVANNLGVARYYRQEGVTFQEIHHWISTDTHHDAFYAMCVFRQMLTQARDRGVTKIYAWSDNGKHFHCAMMWDFFESCSENYGIEWVGNHFEPGEGKNDLDRAFGRLKLAVSKFLRTGKELDGTVKTLLSSLENNIGKDVMHWIDLDRTKQPSTFNDLPGNSNVLHYKFETGRIISRRVTGHGGWVELTGYIRGENS
eukprot:TRINITY_DN11506_c0_g1_i1.p1 TRINITY_DN11506_c0_g1~~TRINITY_DN11506_c0_g1_i1.p1  ORF type:complete len:420 (+),score=17.72 TRINITY_DN11506_c0_g1_i1:869-2128(+)